MTDRSSIEWTDATWNPIRGCARVSAGCMNCYAERVAARFSGPGQPYEGLVTRTAQGPKWTGEVKLIEALIDQPARWRKPRRIFVNSMSDLFHDSLDRDDIATVFEAMERAPWHTYQILTKRPDNMAEFVTRWHHDRCTSGYPKGFAGQFPNVWLGVSVEDQAAADERIPLLLQTPAAVRWISAEPLLGPVSIFHPTTGDLEYSSGNDYAPGSIGWVVAGGESGPGARPVHPDWIRSLRDQCAVAHGGVPFFFKQWGEWAPVGPLYCDSDTAEHLAALDTDPEHSRERWLTVNGADAEPRFQPPADTWAVRRVGKRAAGRQLDGRTHDEYPA